MTNHEGPVPDEQEHQLWWKQTGRAELRQILFWTWDPIGVNDDFPAAADEYDDLLPRLLAVLRAESEVEEVETLLASWARETGIGIDGEAARRKVSAVIAAWRPASLARWRELGPLNPG